VPAAGSDPTPPSAQGVVTGPDCRIGAHAALSHAIVGARVYVCPGARIGQEGFSFARTKDGFLSVPHLGRVVLGDNVEVGANTTIDRSSTGDTVIGAGSRLDNLVQIGGQAAIAGHIRIGQGARLGTQAGVMSDVPAGAALVGSPAQPRQEFFRQLAVLKRMTRREL
jgi:UDP-3-O-[3-hydroxymyristoyl] glucosamine N-acyltransferase